MSWDDMWLNICQKRDECDENIKKMKGVAFFFSSVAALERRIKEKKEKANSQEEEDDQNEGVQEKYWPAISYWIAVQSSNGLAVSTVPLHTALLQTGMEVTAKALPDCKRGGEENSCAPLCTTLKDHNNRFIQAKVDNSFSHSLQLLQDQLIEEPLDSLHASERVVRLQVVCSMFTSKLRDKIIPSLVSSGLQFDVFGIEASDSPSDVPKVTKALASPVVVLMNDIERAMGKLGYAMYCGEVFKRVTPSKYTYQHCCSLTKFLSLLGNNDQFKNSIVNHLSKLVEILGNRECEFMRQLRINYDLIEVNEGWCLSISQRKFVLNPIKETDIGRESPRAFVEFDHTKEPDPGYFKQILENSLNQLEMAHFAEYYVRLLNCRIKQHKEKVMCLIGEPNSGKTSLFTPLTRLIPTRYIAMISKQKAFNKSLVDGNTQIIFLDEAHANLMDPDDWKILTQGGLTAHDRKYKTSSLSVIRCPMFITCQAGMDFGAEHNLAMDARLKKFYFKSLNWPRVAGVQESLRASAMDCIVWAIGLARTPDDELPPPVPGTNSQPGEINEEEKERIRIMQLDESESEQEMSEQADPSTAIDDSESEESDTDSAHLGGLERTLENIALMRKQQPSHTLRQRQLGLLASEVKRAVDASNRQEERTRLRVLEDTKERWISLGIIKEEDAHLLESVHGPYHPTIEKSRQEYFTRKKEEDERMLAKKAREYFDDEWVMEKEKELRDLQKREGSTTDEEVKRALLYMIEVTVEALKLKFQKEEVPGLAKLVLLERRKKAVEMQFVTPSQAQLIGSIWCPLPYPCEEIEDENEEVLFITQSTTTPRVHSRSSSQTPTSQKRRSEQHTSSQVPKRGRITHFFRPSQE